MTTPKSRRELTEAGYRFSSNARCKGCEKNIEWWKTPDNKNAPMSVQRIEGCEVLISHFADCKKVEQFRRVKAIKKVRAERIIPKTGELF